MCLSRFSYGGCGITFIPFGEQGHRRPRQQSDRGAAVQAGRSEGLVTRIVEPSPYPHTNRSIAVGISLQCRDQRIREAAELQKAPGHI